MKALITGIQGFAGSHLCEHLLLLGANVCGTTFPGETSLLPETATQRITLYSCDLRDRRACNDLLQQTTPEVIFHLAAVAFVPQARKDPTAAFDTNVVGSVNLLEAARKHSSGAKVIVISSGEVYGKVSPEEVPTDETARVQPSSFYAATKASVELITRSYHESFDLPAAILRPFSHIGPRQSPSFVTASFARQIALIEAGKKEPVMTVGNLEAQRDFTDVRDMVRAYAIAAEKAESGETYNISSDTAHHIQEVLDTLLSFTSAEITVRQDPALLRPSDTPVFMGNSGKYRKLTGWKPELAFSQSLRDILDYWRQAV